jgi:hypothetical protein
VGLDTADCRGAAAAKLLLAQDRSIPHIVGQYDHCGPVLCQEKLAMCVWLLLMEIFVAPAIPTTLLLTWGLFYPA